MIVSEFLAKLGFHVDDHGLDHAKEKLEGIHRGVSLLVSAEIFKGLFEVAEKFSSVGENLEKVSLAAGITTEQMQKLQYAASQNAVGTEELAHYLGVLGRQLYAAQRGGKGAIELFASVGITPQQVAGFKNSADALYAVQDGINATAKTASEKLGLVQRFFGRGSMGMVKFTSIGSTAAKSLGEEIEAMGGVVSNDGVKSLAELEDTISGLGVVFKGFMMTLGAELAPAIIEGIHSIEQGWKQNSAAIKENMSKFVDSVTFYAGVIYEAIRLVVVTVANFVREHPKLTEWGLKFYLATALAAMGLEAVIGAITKFQQGMGILKLGLKGGGLALRLFQSALYYGALALGYFVSFFSEAWGVRIAAWGTKLGILATNPFLLQMAGYAAIIAGIVLAVQALYAVLFQGKDFSETWLGKLLSMGMDAGKAVMGTVGKFLGIGGNGETEPKIATGVGGTASMVDRMQAQTSGLAALGSMFSGAADMGIPAGPAASVGQLASAAPGQPIVNVDAKITVPPGFNEKQTATVIREGMAGAMQDAMRDAHRSFAPAAMR